MDPTNMALRPHADAMRFGYAGSVRFTDGGAVLVGLPSQRSPEPAEPVVCAALPGRTPAAVHLDGACRCFFGGPPPTTA